MLMMAKYTSTMPEPLHSAGHGSSKHSALQSWAPRRCAALPLGHTQLAGVLIQFQLDPQALQLLVVDCGAQLQLADGLLRKRGRHGMPTPG